MLVICVSHVNISASLFHNELFPLAYVKPRTDRAATCLYWPLLLNCVGAVAMTIHHW